MHKYKKHLKWNICYDILRIKEISIKFHLFNHVCKSIKLREHRSCTFIIIIIFIYASGLTLVEFRFTDSTIVFYLISFAGHNILSSVLLFYPGNSILRPRSVFIAFTSIKMLSDLFSSRS